MTIQSMESQGPASEQKARAIATLLGAASFEEISWRDLMQQGVLVRLSVRRCRFTARLELSDLGVSVSEPRVRTALNRTLVLGEKRLLPIVWMTDLGKIESRARRLLAKSSFTTELGSFLPASCYGEWKRETAKLQTEYFDLRDKIIANHQALMREVLAEYAILAADTYRRIQDVNPESLTMSKEEFVASYCARIESLMPSVERIRATFDFTYTLKDGVKEIGEVELQEGSMVSGEESGQARFRAGTREYQQAAMERDLQQQEARANRAMIDTFLTSIVAQLRQLIYEVATDVLFTLQKRTDGKFSPNSVKQLKNLVKQVKQLNFYGDEEVERLLSQLQGVVDQSPEARQRSLGDIAQKLRAIATVTRATLLNLEEEPRSARELVIPDSLDEKTVRSARTELGLDLSGQDFLMRFETRSERMALAMVPLWVDDPGVGERETRLA
jgi:hypothetical protein